MRKSVHSREAEVLRLMLRNLREEQGLNQEEVAVRLVRPRNYISRYEVGEKMLDLPELRQILKALNKSFQEFMREYDERLQVENSSDFRNG